MYFLWLHGDNWNRCKLGSLWKLWDLTPYYLHLYPNTIFITALLTSCTRYSGGGFQLQGCCRTTLTHRMIDSGSAPLSMLLPTSIVSGRSVTSRSVTVGTL